MTSTLRLPSLLRGSVAAAAVLAASTLGAPSASAEARFGLDGGWYDMTNARNSASAVFGGTSGGPVVGAHVRFSLGESLFLGAHGRFMRRTGERVFVEEPGGEVFELGHPLTVQIVPVFGLVGFRFGRDSSLQPYVGIGAGVTSYSEESTIAGEVESSSKTKPSGHAAFGFDYGRGSLRFGAELGYSLVPNTIGEGGVSRVYGEDDVGGLTVVLRVSFGS